MPKVYDPDVVEMAKKAQDPSKDLWGFGQTLYDLESVQVLKGVQGTLFGRNMTGGAVLVTRTDGTIRDIGLCNVTVGQIEEARRIARQLMRDPGDPPRGADEQAVGRGLQPLGQRDVAGVAGDLRVGLRGQAAVAAGRCRHPRARRARNRAASEAASRKPNPQRHSPRAEQGHRCQATEAVRLVQ